jgi:hypothetical protein
MKNWRFWRGGGREFSIVKLGIGGIGGQPQNFAKSKLAGESTLGSHGSTHRLAMNMVHSK